MHSPQSLKGNYSPRYFLSPKQVKLPQMPQSTANSSRNFPIDSTTNISKSKMFLNDRTASTEISQSQLNTARVKKEIKFPPIKMPIMLKDRSNSVDTQFSISSIRNKQNASPTDQLKTDRPISRIISGAVTPVKSTLLEEPFSPYKFDDSAVSLSKRAINAKLIADPGAVSRFAKRSQTMDSLAPLKAVLSDYEKA